MPVFPLVGSTSTLFPGWIAPSRSAASIMARPIRSFTLFAGFWPSSFATIRAGTVVGARSLAELVRYMLLTGELATEA